MSWYVMHVCYACMDRQVRDCGSSHLSMVAYAVVREHEGRFTSVGSHGGEHPEPVVVVLLGHGIQQIL